MKTTKLRILSNQLAFFALSAFGLAGIAAATPLPGTPNAATPPFTLNFDEKGSALLNGSPIIPSGITGGGLQYFLPGLVQPGDVLIQAPFDINSANPNGDSDLLSFTSGPGLNGVVTGIMTYQSLAEPADPLLPADVQRFTFSITPPNPSLLTETGTELLNGFNWIVPGATYNGISDGILSTPTPEPSTIVLGGLAVLSLATVAYRRRAAGRVEATG